MILVVGGTGTLGRELVKRLRSEGRALRVLTREPGRASEAAQLGADVVRGDVRDERRVQAAVSGCTAIVSAAHGFLGGRRSGPSVIDDRGNATLVLAAERAGVENFVMLSTYGARADHPLELHRAKFAGEQHVRAAGVPWTVLRPTVYLETWTTVVGAKVADGGPALILGRGQNPINFVSVRDVAATVHRALTDDALHGQVVDVAGQQNLTLVELGRQLGATEMRHIPRAALALLRRATAPIAPAAARRAATALFMDTQPMAVQGPDCTT